MDISIIIINWNVRELLYHCLQSVFLFTSGVEYEIIVVDNHSTDASSEMLRGIAFDHDNAQIIFNQKNFGFARANNQGLQRARGKYVLFMNPDMEFVENTPRILFDFMEQNQNVSACTCQLQYPTGERQPNIKRDPTFWSQIWILYKLHHVYKPRFLKKYLAKDFDYTRAQEAEQIMGAFVFMRADVMKKIGGWSEDYFIWWEDVDLCKRLRQLKETIMYTPRTRVIHYESKSFVQQRSFLRQKRFTKGMLIYFKKYHNKLAWLWLWLASLDSLVLAWIAQLFKFYPKSQAKL